MKINILKRVFVIIAFLVLIVCAAILKLYIPLAIFIMGALVYFICMKKLK